jgi:hypothetical protein
MAPLGSLRPLTPREWAPTANSATVGQPDWPGRRHAEPAVHATRGCSCLLRASEGAPTASSGTDPAQAHALLGSSRPLTPREGAPTANSSPDPVQTRAHLAARAHSRQERGRKLPTRASTPSRPGLTWQLAPAHAPRGGANCQLEPRPRAQPAPTAHDEGPGQETGALVVVISRRGRTRSCCRRRTRRHRWMPPSGRPPR